MDIIAGALELRKKTVANVMTRIEDVYMLDYNRILDFETISEIMSSGESSFVDRKITRDDRSYVFFTDAKFTRNAREASILLETAQNFYS